MTVGRPFATAGGALATALMLAGCGSEPPDYQSIWSTSASSTAAQTSPERPVPFAQYLEGRGVQGEPVDPATLTDLRVTLPRPTGWTTYRNANLAPKTVAIARDNNYPTAMLLVFRLHGGFDVQQAIQRAGADALLSQDFTKLNESFDDFDGFPSAMIEGSYLGANNKRLHSYNRVVIPVTPAPAFQRYLVGLTVTGIADRAVADSADIEAIIGGFTVAVR